MKNGDLVLIKEKVVAQLLICYTGEENEAFLRGQHQILSVGSRLVLLASSSRPGVNVTFRDPWNMYKRDLKTVKVVTTGVCSCSWRPCEERRKCSKLEIP